MKYEKGTEVFRIIETEKGLIAQSGRIFSSGEFETSVAWEKLGHFLVNYPNRTRHNTKGDRKLPFMTSPNAAAYRFWQQSAESVSAMRGDLARAKDLENRARCFVVQLSTNPVETRFRKVGE